jgi:nitrate/TMAO reductase-like tetraheme cytochrome c subunit
MRKSHAISAAIALVLGATLCAPSFAEDHDERHEHRKHQEGHGLPALVANKTWAAECGACHVAYVPGLLPERSWRAVMNGLDRHFGENASLDAATHKSIAEFLAANAADRGDSRLGRRSAALAAGETPLRITELAWFERKHDELRPDVWKRKEVGSRANCSACHPGAEKGRFSEHEVVVPGSSRRHG